MTTTHIVMLVGIIVSGAVALIIASQQRKQMRQIELYKSDPSVGLIPPSSALTRFVKSKWDMLLGFGGPILGLSLEFLSDDAITRLSILFISLNVALLLTNIVMTVIFRAVDRLSGTISRLAGAMENNVEAFKDHVEITRAHTRIIEKLSSYEKNSRLDI